MSKYRKKPVVIEAMRYTGTPDTCVAIHEWCGYQHNPEAGCDSGIYIDTLEGQMRADVGDWIIRGVQGEFYPCKPDIFEETYEPVDEGAKWAAVSRLQAAVVAATPRGGLAMSDFEQARTSVPHLVAALEAVLDFTARQRDEIRARYDMTGGIPADYRGFANACDDVIALIEDALKGSDDDH